MSLSNRDKALLWHPFTQEKTSGLSLAIIKGEDSRLYDENGKSYLDLISSWWVNLHGHGHPAIAEAIYNQAKKLEHVIFAGFTHEPAVELCEKLKSILPESLSRFFFSDNGSSAVEIALKMAYQYWWNNGNKERVKFLSFEGGYHGDTFGAMSVSKGSDYHSVYKKLFFEVNCLTFPSTWDNDANIEEKEEKCLKEAKKYLELHHHETAAMILEPLVQGASGMRFCRPIYLKKLIALLRSYDILIIFDEIMTGFGRTGLNFALDHLKSEAGHKFSGVSSANQLGSKSFNHSFSYSEQNYNDSGALNNLFMETKKEHNLYLAESAENEAIFAPDIICLSKGLTGGFLPLALTVSSDKIYNAFLGENFTKAFAHGHSYTANPLGCAAANASLNLLLSAETKKNIASIAKSHQNHLLDLKNSCSFIKSTRSFGTIAAFNLESEEHNYVYSHTAELKKRFLAKGLILRPIGNTIYLIPPYCITSAELEESYNIIEEVVKDL